MRRSPRAGKGPGGWGGVELWLKEQKGHRCGPHPWSQRVGDITREPRSLWGLKWAGQMPSTLLPLLPDGSTQVPLLISPASLLYAQDPCSLEGALEGRYQPGSSAGSPATVGQGITLCFSPTLPEGSLPPASPDLLGLRGADSDWPKLLLPPQSPHILPVHFGVPSISLGVRVHHQWPTGALVVGRC